MSKWKLERQPAIGDYVMVTFTDGTEHVMHITSIDHDDEGVGEHGDKTFYQAVYFDAFIREMATEYMITAREMEYIRKSED